MGHADTGHAACPRHSSANINYRFADDDRVHWPQLLEDIDSALSYCAGHAAEWHTRRDNFVMNGESAGAHLALLYGYTTANKIGAVIAECAPTNLSDTALLNYYHIHDTLLFHAVCKLADAHYEPGQQPGPAFAAASPVSHVKNLPILFFHGTADKVVPYPQALDLEKVLQRKGYVYKFVPMPDENHDLGLNVFATRSLIYREMVEWIWKYGK